MRPIGAVGGGDEHAGVDDQHGSVATEAVGEQRVDAMGDTFGGRAGGQERQRGAGGRLRLDRCRLGRELSEGLRGELLDRDATRRGRGEQTTEHVVGELNRQCHEPSVRSTPRLVTVVCSLRRGRAPNLR